MRDVPDAQFGERLDRRDVPHRLEPAIEVAFHAVLECNRTVGVAPFPLIEPRAHIPVEKVVGGLWRQHTRNVGRIDDFGTARLEQGNDFCHRGALCVAQPATCIGAAPGSHAVVKERAWYADTRAFECRAVEESCVVTISRWRTQLGRGIVCIRRGTFHRAQHDRCVGHGTSHWAWRILISRDRNYTIPAHASDRRLDADEKILLRRRKH